MKKNMLAIAVVLALLGWSLYDYSQAKKSSAPQFTSDGIIIGIKQGNAAPDFALTTLNGTEARLSDYLGRTVVINFWATWCPPCKAEMPHMEKFFQQFNADAVVLAVNLTHTETNSKAVAEFVDKHELSFPILLDEQALVSEQYRISAYPTTYIIDKQGIVQQVHQGAVSYETLKKSLLLAR